MDKRYIIVVSIMIVLWAAFMAYRHQKRKQDTGAYRQKTYDQVTEAAKTSPKAGLARVGMALQRYQKDHNAYPSSLTELYPKYLANKSLIEEIDWYYEPRGDDFLLSKTLIVGDRRMVASIDKGLRPTAEKPVMVATPTPVPEMKEVKKPKEVATAERPEPSEPQALEERRLVQAREEFLKALRQRHMDVTSVSLPERDEARVIATAYPEIISIIEEDIIEGLESELSQRFLVWKDKHGVLGFSNLRYPDGDSLSIHGIGRWYNVKIPSLEDQAPSYTETETAKKEKEPDMMAASLKGRYLVWKDRQGNLGFGNVRYPETDLASVLQADGWVSVQRPQPATETRLEQPRDLKKAKSPETIGSTFATQHLVWKDEHGTLGFGNSQYPESGVASVFQTDGWVSVQTPQRATESGLEQKRGPEKAKSAETIASAFGTQYLVWKDKHGTLGFGNSQYPKSGVASVLQTDGWINLQTPQQATGSDVEQERALEKAKAGETIASAFSMQYLVWKDNHGTLGFGNGQYPKTKDISHVHVNGGWEPVTE